LNQRIVSIDPKNPDPANWKTIIAEKPENISSATTSGGKLFLTYLKDVTSRVYVYDYNGKLEREVKLPALGTAGGFGGEKDDKFVFYTFTSITFHQQFIAMILPVEKVQFSENRSEI
jgi:Serine proteases of the peptidase family S9A